ncbi:hypothetical protein HK102_011464 [Quaeritorhiza haematococci]|nr:hypothetical protein HK102_011464 [Quaeritorhiza haematococci]
MKNNRVCTNSFHSGERLCFLCAYSYPQDYAVVLKSRAMTYFMLTPSDVSKMRSFKTTKDGQTVIWLLEKEVRARALIKFGSLHAIASERQRRIRRAEVSFQKRVAAYDEAKEKGDKTKSAQRPVLPALLKVDVETKLAEWESVFWIVG